MRFITYKDDQLRREREVIPGIYDPVFKSIFIKVKGVLEEVITGIDNIITKEDAKHITILNNEFPKDTIFEKGKVSDLVVRIKDKIIDIEMNKSYYEDLIKRNNAYAEKLQSLFEDKYIIQINIDAFSAFDKESSIIKFQMISDKKQIDKTFIIKYHVNLEVIENKYYNKIELTRIEKILLMFKLKDRKELIKLSKGDELMERIYEELDNMSKDKENLLYYSKHELEMEGIKEQLKEQFKSQGIEEGKKENRMEIAKNMLNRNMDITTISEITGLSIREIESLK